MHLHQQFYKQLKTIFPQIELITGLPKMNEIDQDKLPKLILLDDLMGEIFDSPSMCALFTQISHHASISIIFTSQNYFDTGSKKTIMRNCNYKIVFKDPTDQGVLHSIGRAMVPKQPNFLNTCFDSLKHYFPAAKCPYLLIDGAADETMEGIYFRTNIFPDDDLTIRPICFFPNPQYKKKN